MAADNKAGEHKKETKSQTDLHRLQTLTHNTYYISLRLSKQILETIRESNGHRQFNA